jgi:hypothetical protein
VNPGLIGFLFLAGAGVLYALSKLKPPPAANAPGALPAPDHQSKFFQLGKPSAPGVLATGTGWTAPYIDPNSVTIPQPNFPDIQTMFGGSMDTAPPLPPPPDAPTQGTDIIVEDGINRMIQAIGHAEGYGVPGAIPTRANNPGDLKLGDHGQGTIQDKTIFATPYEGWVHGRAQIRLMYLGKSAYYTSDDTFEKIAQTWTGGQNSQAWLNTVTTDLGVSPNTTLRGYLTGGTVRK